MHLRATSALLSSLCLSLLEQHEVSTRSAEGMGWRTRKHWKPRLPDSLGPSRWKLGPALGGHLSEKTVEEEGNRTLLLENSQGGEIEVKEEA